jgi:hypothetical protein
MATKKRQVNPDKEVDLTTADLDQVNYGNDPAGPTHTKAPTVGPQPAPGPSYEGPFKATKHSIELDLGDRDLRELFRHVIEFHFGRTKNPAKDKLLTLLNKAEEEINRP